MVKTSGIREKLRSSVLKDLARERGTKRSRKDAELDSEDSDSSDEGGRDMRLSKTEKPANSSLLSILPKPKNSSIFGPTVRLDRILKMPERADGATMRRDNTEDNSIVSIGEDGMIKVDVGKAVTDLSQTVIKDLTKEKAQSSVVVPKGKEREKNQITYLAKLGKATELERKDAAALGRLNKAAARSKYGW